jgi:hypothetical protein
VTVYESISRKFPIAQFFNACPISDTTGPPQNSPLTLLGSLQDNPDNPESPLNSPLTELEATVLGLEGLPSRESTKASRPGDIELLDNDATVDNESRVKLQTMTRLSTMSMSQLN